MQKLLYIFLILFSFYNQVFAQHQTDPKKIEVMQRYVYFLDNGFEKIDLLKVGSVDRSFFTLGNPRLIIARKNDPSLKNLLNSFTIAVQPSDPSVQSKVFPIKSPAFTEGCRQMIYVMKPESKITFTEVQLNVIDPGTTSTPGAKYQNAPGMLPVSFFLYLK
ncbi:MAG: hypothetical protein ACK4K9_05840 [Bacteroidia bacterium]